MTLGEFAAAATSAPHEVRALRRRAVVRRMQQLTRQQRERELCELGYRDHGGEA